MSTYDFEAYYGKIYFFRVRKLYILCLKQELTTTSFFTRYLQVKTRYLQIEFLKVHRP